MTLSCDSSVSRDIMSKPKMISVRLDGDLVDAMDALQERYGTPLAEQIRRALRPWLEAQGVLKATAPAKSERGKRSKESK